MRVQHPDLAVAGFPEVVFRYFRGPEDFRAIVAVQEACRERDQVDVYSAREGIPTVASLENMYGKLEPESPDWLFAEVDGTVVGYTHVQWWTETGPLEVYLHLGWVVPNWRGRGIGRTLLRWAEQRSQEIHAHRAPHHAATFAANCSSTQPDAQRLLHHAGYEAARLVSDMICLDLVHVPPMSNLPTGLTDRPIDSEDARQVYDAYKDAWRGGVWGITPETDADYQAFLDDNVRTPLFDPSLWQVAWDGEEVAGFVIAVLDGGVGKFPEVAVRKRWQRRGVGTTLMSRAMRLLREREASQLRIITNADNPVGAKTVYERLGFREVKQHGLYRKPF